MATGEGNGQARLRVRAAVGGTARPSVATGVSVLDHLLSLLAEYASFELSLEVEPGSAAAEIAAAGRALGEALWDPLRGEGVRGYGAATVPADEALAHVAIEASGRPLVVSNVDLSDVHVAGLGTDVVSAFLREVAAGAGLTVHVRLIEGSDPQHVLETIFKGLGVSLAQACHARRPKREER
jgi:imidazoleglycerol-phosphate dehydratase